MKSILSNIRSYLQQIFIFSNSTVEYAFYSFFFFLGLTIIGYFVPSTILIVFVLAMLVIVSFLSALLIEFIVEVIKHPRGK